MGLETVDAVQDRIISTFPRTDPAVQQMVEQDFDVWVKALCRIHPWWFNTVRPGSVSSLFPVSDPNDLLPGPTGAGRWFHRGWLITEPGVDVYEFKAPFSDTQPDLGFHDAQVTKVHFIKRMDLSGRFLGAVPLRTSNFALTRMDLSDPMSSSHGPMAWVEHFPEVSVLRLQPTPMEEVVLAVQFTLGAAPSYDVGQNTYNRVVSYAPDVVVQFGLMKLAEYFVESKLYTEHRETLYGNPPLGVSVPGTLHGGMLADLRQQGANMFIDDDARVEYYVGANAPYHNAPRRGRARRGFYRA